MSSAPFKLKPCQLHSPCPSTIPLPTQCTYLGDSSSLGQAFSEMDSRVQKILAWSDEPRHSFGNCDGCCHLAETRSKGMAFPLHSDASSTFNIEWSPVERENGLQWPKLEAIEPEVIANELARTWSRTRHGYETYCSVLVPGPRGF